MGIVNLPRVPASPTIEQLAQIVAQLSEQLEYVMNGFLDSTNAREFGGWQVGQTELQSKDKKVGMSSKNTAADDTRFWAGDLISGSPSFKVTKAGIMTAISALLMSAVGYPRVELNSANKLFAAYQSADSYVSMNPAASNNIPGLNFHNGTGVDGLIYLFNQVTQALAILTPAGSADIQIGSGKDLILSANTVGGYAIKIDKWDYVKKGDGVTLQQSFDAKADKGTFTGTFNYVKGVNFAAQSYTTGTVTVTNGVIMGVT